MAEESLKRQTKKGLYWKFAEQFSNYGVQFIIGVFMARLLSPSDYGITALPAVFMAVAGIFVEAGFAGALIRKPELKEEDLSTAFFYSMVIGIFCYVLLFFASPWIADFYSTPVLKPLMRVTALSFIFTPIGVPQSVILKRKLDFKTLAKIAVFVKILSGIVGVAMAFYGYGVWALVISGLFATLSGLFITISVVRWFPKTGWSRDSFRYLWGYGNKMMGSALLEKIYVNIVPIFVGKYYSTADLGVYNRASQYSSMLSSNATEVLQQVTFPVLSKIQDEDEMLRQKYRQIIRVSAFVIFPLMMMLSALSRPLIIVMITEKWEDCILLLQLMCFSMMWYPVHAINLNLLQVKGRSDLFLRLEIIKKAYGIAALVITLPISLVAVVLSRWVTNVLSLIVNTYYTQKIINVGFLMQMRDLMPTFALSLSMFGLIHLVNLFIADYFLQLFVGGVVGTIFYIGGAVLLKFPELNDVKYLLHIRE